MHQSSLLKLLIRNTNHHINHSDTQSQPFSNNILIIRALQLMKALFRVQKTMDNHHITIQTVPTNHNVFEYVKQLDDKFQCFDKQTIPINSQLFDIIQLLCILNLPKTIIAQKLKINQAQKIKTKVANMWLKTFISNSLSPSNVPSHWRDIYYQSYNQRCFKMTDNIYDSKKVANQNQLAQSFDFINVCTFKDFWQKILKILYMQSNIFINRISYLNSLFQTDLSILQPIFLPILIKRLLISNFNLWTIQQFTSRSTYNSNTMYPNHENYYPFYPSFYELQYQIHRKYWQELVQREIYAFQKNLDLLQQPRKDNDLNSHESSFSTPPPKKIQAIPKKRLKKQKKATKIEFFPQKASYIHKKSKNKSHQFERNNTIYQREGRNANSNLLRIFFRTLQTRFKNEPEIIDIISKRNNLQIDPKGFYEWYEFNSIDHTKYVRLPPCKPIFFGKKDYQVYSKVMRIFLKDFLNKEVLLYFLTSKKMKKSFMPHNYRAMTCILNDVHRAAHDS